MASTSFSKQSCDLSTRDPLLDTESQSRFQDVIVDVVIVSLTKMAWLNDRAREFLPAARILHFQYEKVQGSPDAAYTIEHITEHFLDRLLSMRKECPLRPIVFIGNSSGGLVITKALVLPTLTTAISRITAGIVFYCTPDPVKSSQALLPFKQEVRSLTKDYYDLLALVNTKAILVHSFFEPEKTDLSSPSDKHNSASIIFPGFPSHPIMIDSNISGFSMPLLSQESDQVVTDFVQEAPSRITARLDDTVHSSNTHIDWTPGRGDFMNLLSDGSYKTTLNRNMQSLTDGHGSWILRTSQLTEWINAANSKLLWVHGDSAVGKTTATTVITRELVSLQKLRDRLDIKPGEGPLQYTGNVLAYFFCERSGSNQQSATLILSNLLHQILQQRPDFVQIIEHRFKEWQEPGYFSSPKALADLWSLISTLLNDHSVNTAFLIIDGLDDEIPLHNELLRLLEPYIDGIPQKGCQTVPTQYLPTGSAQPLHLRGGASNPPPPPPPPGQFRPPPPPGFHRLQLPPPSENNRPGPPSQYILNPRRAQPSSEIVDITSQIPLTKDECRRKLRTYKAFSIRKVPPSKAEEKPTWARAQITEESLSQQEISTKITNLGMAPLSVSEKKAALAPFQQGQVDKLLDDMNYREHDRNFEWTLVQLERQEKEIRVGLREMVVLSVFVQRVLRDNLDPITIFRTLERFKADPMIPPHSRRFPSTPPREYGGAHHRGSRPAGVVPKFVGGGNGMKFKKGFEKSHTSSTSSYSRQQRRFQRPQPRRKPIKLGRKLREELRIRRMNKRKSPKHGWVTMSDTDTEFDSDGSNGSSVTPSTLKVGKVTKNQFTIPLGVTPTPRPRLTTKLCIFITSRNTDSFSRKLAKTLNISIDLTVEEQTMRLIERNLSTLPGLSEQNMEELKVRLNARAQGRFTWVKLAIREIGRLKDHIANSTLSALTLDTLPNELEGFYQLYVTRGDGLSNTLGKAVLTCMSTAIRPLSMDELRFLLKSSVEPEVKLQAGSGLGPYLKVTGSFLEISNDGRIWFVDETARQFVNKLLKNDQTDLESFHATLAQHCLNYLVDPEVSINQSAFVEYPLAYWMDHCRLASTKLVLTNSMMQGLFQMKSQLAEERVAKYWEFKYPEGERPTKSTFLHIFAEAGSCQLFQQVFNYLCSQGNSLEYFDSADSLGNLPLHWAARNGHVQIVESLWVVTDNLDMVNYDELTPLHFAAIGGHCKIAKGLIHRGASINSRGRNSTTVLHSASIKGHEKMVQLLLDAGAFIDATDMDGYRAQHLARVSGHNVVADMLKKFESRMISTEPLPARKRIDGGFLGTIIDFVHPESGLYIEKHIPVDKMLSNESFDSIMSFARGRLRLEREYDDLEGESPKERRIRWLHLPANNMRWVEILLSKHYRDLDMPEAARAVLRSEVWVDRQHQAKETIIHGRFMKPGCQRVSTRIALRRDKSRQESGILFTIPYLNWASEEERMKLNRISKEVAEAKVSGKLDVYNSASERTDRYERLVWSYLYDEHPLHIRRTLDQSYYNTLDSTESRDVDQIPQKYFAQHCEGSTMQPVLMVDQLWLWVLDQNTVITSFPQRWTEPKEHDLDNENKTDVLETIVRSLDKNDATISDSYKLAEFIVNACTSLCFTVSLANGGTLPFPGCYETIIGQVADQETKLFQKFTKALTIEATKVAEESSKYNAEIDEKVFSIHEETEQLQLIKDVRDELNMILMVLKDQIKAVEEADTASPDQWVKRNSLRERIYSYQDEIKQLDHRAEKVYIALKDLLDLKQKQANVAEARSQRHQAEETSNQGKAILLFTIITIVFLPLSFMASFFALQIVEFPTLTLSFVLRYMFPISAAISIPCIIVALNFETLSKLEMKRVHWAYFFRAGRAPRVGTNPRQKGYKGDVEKGLKDAETDAKVDASPEATNSGSSMPMRSGTARRTKA